MKGKQIDLVIDSKVKPIAQKCRRIPFHLRKKVESEISKLLDQDIIERVPENEQTDWHTLQLALQGLNGVKNIADDIIIFGKDVNEHNENLNACLRRLKELNLTLNFEKCKFLKENLEFSGFIFSKEGKRPDPKKIAVFVNAATPTTSTEPGSAQENIVAFASRSLSSVELRYSQTEKEALAIVWGIEHYHLYLFGSKFTLVTDHKPLEIIYANPCSKPPAHIERWMLRLQQYDCEVVYKSGIGNPADYLSRHPTSAEYKKQNISDEYVNFVTQEAVFPALSLGEIKAATDKDTTLRCLRAAIRSNCWNGDILQPFRAIKHEISVDLTNNILLRGTRIIIPESLQRHVIKIAHEGHQGTAKT
eukprot:gene10145-18811_t